MTKTGNPQLNTESARENNCHVFLYSAIVSRIFQAKLAFRQTGHTNLSVQHGPDCKIIRANTFILFSATPGKNGIFFKLKGLRTRVDETILSANLRVMVKTIGPQPSFSSSNGNLVLYDQFNHKPLQSVAIQAGEAKLVVFPLLNLVKRWLRFPCSNHGVYIRIHSNHQGDEKSLRVTLDCTSKARDNRPLLVVQTQSKPQKVYEGSFQTR